MVGTINEDKPFQVEIDTSNLCITATLNQERHPVAFWSQTLNAQEQHHSPVEKGVAAMLEVFIFDSRKQAI